MTPHKLPHPAAETQGPVLKRMAAPYQRNGYTILNRDGDVWGDQIFANAGQAIHYLDQFWNGKREMWADVGFTLAPAACTVIVTGKERIKL